MPRKAKKTKVEASIKETKVDSCLTSSDFTRLDPALQPLFMQVADISERLGVLRSLVDVKMDELEVLFKKARLIDRKTAAKLLSMSQSQFDRQVRAGKLANIYINRRTRVTLGDLEKYVEARRIAGRPATQKKAKKVVRSSVKKKKTKAKIR